MKKLHHHILELLADGKFHSGEELGIATGITRSAVWKIVKQLMLLHLPIHSLKGKGYQLENGLELLHESTIRRNLLPPALKKISQIDIFDTIDSTNQYLLDKAKTSGKSGAVCLAEYQHSGRGRRGRPWYSPFASNIYFSLLWFFVRDPVELSGLSLAITIAVTRVLKHYGIKEKLAVKWPNDVLWEKQKLAGILLEMLAEPHTGTKVVIGIGLNMTMSNHKEIPIDQPWTDVKNIIGQQPRNLFVAALINELVNTLDLFETHGLLPFLSEWESLDITRNQEIALHAGEHITRGIGLGITEKGELLLTDSNNNVQRFLSGEVSLRLVTPS